jgi:hypothetical protein
MEGWIVLGSLILMGFGGLFAFICAIDNDNKGCRVGGIIFLIGLVLLGLFMFASIKSEKLAWDRPESPYVTHSIIALSDGNEIEGRFRGGLYCMSGYINEEFTYVYGYRTAYGGMKIQKVSADSAVVYFTDDIEPCAKWYKETKKFWWSTRERYTCDIYVPTDSLKAGITIDLE